MTLSIGPKLVLATHNPGKLREIADLWAPHGIATVSAASFGLSEPEETENSFAGNALIKARVAACGSGLPALADDSGLCVDALDGAPGVHTADWAETPTGRDWAIAMRRVEDALAALGSTASRHCHFHCTLALAWPDGQHALFEGQCYGHLIWPPRGGRGFGYDPMFVPDGHVETFGEMDPETKHRISHRAAAFAAMMRALGGAST